MRVLKVKGATVCLVLVADVENFVVGKTTAQWWGKRVLSSDLSVWSITAPQVGEKVIPCLCRKSIHHDYPLGRFHQFQEEIKVLRPPHIHLKNTRYKKKCEYGFRIGLSREK